MPYRNHQEDAAVSGFGESASAAVSGMGAQAAEMASKATDYVGTRADRATGAVGAGMESVAEGIRRVEPAEGMLHNMGEAVACKLDSGGRYLEEQGLAGMGADITNLVRRHPIPALLVGVGVGLLIARMVRR